MFRLLRRIRRRLVGEGSFRKYLLYATGEFLLIVGGVLVALSLNNWNIEQQNRQEEQVILSQILGEPRTMNRTVNRIRNGIERKSETLADLEAQYSGTLSLSLDIVNASLIRADLEGDCGEKVAAPPEASVGLGALILTKAIFTIN